MKYKLYVPALGETIEDAHEMDCKFGFEDLTVSDFCQHLFSNRDGWEWMKNDSGYTKIHIVDENGNESVYSFDIDYEPVFSVYKEKAK